ncbi:SCP2 sterol-binding domain-containing protein [Virgibacillus ndiopensis]|uniref:SCP2 sterol-binding domain-containing protein n=1 Tax=Virgibacillus ndiopensis TaxID=2004408 RepID=UPI00159BB918|nr:SCP2 sterol-binding domain-containing protein [Virgibacillus ndiopensis]
MISIKNSTVKEIWQFIDEQLRLKKEPYKDVNAVYEFQILDEENGVYQMVFADQQATVHFSAENEADCILKMKEKHFKLFLLGDLNSSKAFMTGKLKIKGKLSLALKLEDMLKQYQLDH